MALNFPQNPEVNDLYTEGGTTWKYDGVVWNIDSSLSAVNLFQKFAADTGTAQPTTALDTLTVVGGINVTTAVSGKNIIISSTGGGLTQNVFDTITADEGSTTAASINDTLNILGGTNIATSIATDTDNVTINLQSFSIDFLSDVDTTSSAPTTGQVLKWDGGKWAPGADATTGGAGTDADTLDGFDGAYYLDYNNLNNTPAILALDSLSVGVENPASGNGAISYDNATGVFKFTPPTAAGIGALTAEVNDLTSAVTWANVPNVNITESAVTQHQAALSVTESQISDLQSYLTSVSASDLNTISIDALSDVDTTSSAPSTNDVLQWNGTAWVPAVVVGGGGGDPDQNIWQNVSGDSGTVTANTTTDTLTIEGGTNITTSAANDTITIDFSGTLGSSTFSGTTDATTAGLNVSKIYMPAIAMLTVDNDGTSAYTFNSHYSGNNPTIYALSGTTIAFDLTNATGHPFEIQNPSSNPYNTGLVHVDTDGTVSTGSNAQGKSSGVLYWQVPETISGTYRYQCQSHIAMVGGIFIKRLSVI
jgi:plastocyanin